MKLATFSAGAGKRLGAIVPGTNQILDLAQAHVVLTGTPDPCLVSMQSLINGGANALSRAKKLLSELSATSLLSLSAIKLHAPLEPIALRCCSVFEAHHRASQRAVQRLTGRPQTEGSVPPLFKAIPAYCKGNHLNIADPEGEIPWPSFADNMDFELELAAVVGQRGRDVGLDEAKSHIFGYTIFNDVSARSPQLEEMAMMLGPAKSKDFDGANILGPYIVTSDELDGDNVLGIARVNGREVGRCRTTEMGHDWRHIIAYRSFGETMHPGEVIACGAFPTCTGVERLEFLNPGDEIELEIEGIGILRNRVGARPARATPWPPILS